MKVSLLIVWVLLLAFTLAGFFIAEEGVMSQRVGWICILLLASAKAQLLCDFFMSLRPVGGCWRLLLGAYGWIIFLLVAVILYV